MSDPPNPADRFMGFLEENDIETKTIDDPYDNFNRTHFERDRDRVLYDRYFRRLKDVTQVARAGESYEYHDRLTHSLKVAQVGRRISELLRRRRKRSQDHEPIPKPRLDPDVVETACLAHDMGHPPFGHLAEDELDKLLVEITHPEGDQNGFDPDADDEVAYRDGDTPGGLRYEGNAQTFRIITRLAAHNDPVESGLGLTRASLKAVLKYPYGRGEWIESEERSRGKFGYYKTEKDAFDFAWEGCEDELEPDLAAQIMDYADDVTYAIHDVTDFYQTGQIPLDRLLREGRDRYEAREEPEADVEEIDTDEIDSFSEYLEGTNRVELEVTSPYQLFTRLAESAMGYPTLFNRFSGSQRERNLLDGFKSYLIGFYLNTESEVPGQDNNIRLVKNESDSYSFSVDDELEEEISILRELTHYYVIRDSSLMAQQSGEREVIRKLFRTLYEEAKSEDMSLTAIPRPYSEWVSADRYRGSSGPSAYRQARAVADFIASMTEKQAFQMYKRLTGHGPGSLENQIVK